MPYAAARERPDACRQRQFVPKKQGLEELRERDEGPNRHVASSPRIRCPTNSACACAPGSTCAAVAASHRKTARRATRRLRTRRRAASCCSLAGRAHIGIAVIALFISWPPDHHFEHDPPDRLCAPARNLDHATRRRDQHVHSRCRSSAKARSAAYWARCSPSSCSASAARGSCRNSYVKIPFAH